MRRLAVLTSGGDAPGMNAAIRAVTRAAIAQGVEVVGIRRGYEGLLEGDIIPMSISSVGGIIHRGGTILRTARCERFLRPEGVNEGLDQLRTFDIDALVVIGGDGSFRGAWELDQRGFPVAGVPGTIDNDVAGTDATIGFDTAANTALEAVVRLRDTASSHDRLFIVEVMGRGSGYLALYVGVSGGAELVVVPEVPFDLERTCERLHYGRKRGKTHSLIVLAEGVMPAHELAAKLQDTGGYDARITVIGHIQRGGGPTAADAVLASRMGAHAVEALLAGERGIMVGSVDNAMVTSPLPTAWESKKALPQALLRLVDTLSI
ncbi:MAG TPA: 6-phosphofructokinase [Synergistaceae bacterium]|nr:6-phosphofructokinase [Synergistaceae bacterium]